MAAVALAVSLAWLVLFSPALRLRTVEVVGVAAPLTGPVRTAADAPVGQALARVNLSALSRRVAAVPDVASVEVHRSWPHAVRLVVTPRRPSAVLDDDGRWTLLDPRGLPFRDVPRPPKGLPQVLDTPRSAPELLAAVTVVQGLPRKLAAQVVAVSALTPDAVTLRLTEGRSVVWGNSARSALKARVSLILLAGKGLVVDVSAPLAPAVR